MDFFSREDGLLPAGDLIVQRYDDRLPFSVRSGVVDAAVGVDAVTTAIAHVARIPDERPADAGVVAVLQQNRGLEGERLTTADIDLQFKEGIKWCIERYHSE